MNAGYQWAEPDLKEIRLSVRRVGDKLQIRGRFPTYTDKGRPTDVLHQYETARKSRSVGKKRTGKDSPHIRFANAKTDEDLIAFVRCFGPVVARSVKLEGGPPVALIATQDMEELRNEHATYRAALTLLMELRQRQFDYAIAQSLIREIAAKISDWPRQWERERSEGKQEPFWKLSASSIARIQQLSYGLSDDLLPPNLDGRIVICELLNAFRATVFPNPVEMHTSIRFGIRPLLYAILRREFLYPHETSICKNGWCRHFFEIERAGQQFCSSECSRQQRQRDYWKKRGKKLRARRRKKPSRHA